MKAAVIKEYGPAENFGKVFPLSEIGKAHSLLENTTGNFDGKIGIEIE